MSYHDRKLNIFLKSLIGRAKGSKIAQIVLEKVWGIDMDIKEGDGEWAERGANTFE